ncbi:heme exporter protein CcmB [Sphingomonas sp.]
MNGFAAMLWRDMRRAWTGGALWLPVAFFLLVAVLFPFAVGPDRVVLERIAPGVVWAAALLAALLPVERLVAPDIDAGVIDQMVVRGWNDAAIATAKIAAHWLGFTPPLILASGMAGGLLGMSGETMARAMLSLAIGTPGLAALGVATAALTAGLRGAGAIAGLVMLPLALPLVIFGAGEGPGAMKLLGAVSLLLLAGGPFVAGAAMRVARG